MSEVSGMSNDELRAAHDSADDLDFNDVRNMAGELLHLRAVVANAIELINSGRCGLGHEVLITRKLNNE